MERSENEIVAAPPFSTVQVKPPRFFARMVSSPFSRNTPFQLPTIRFSAFAAMLLWNRLLLARATATSRSASTETRRTAFFFFGFLPLAGMGASSAGVISAGAESASGAAVFNFFAAVHTEDSVFRDRAAAFGTKHKIFLSLLNMWKTRHRSIPLERV